MKTFEDYYNGLLKMKLNLWIGDEKVDRSDPRIRGGMNIIKVTFDKAYDPDFQDLCVATSHFSPVK